MSKLPSLFIILLVSIVVLLLDILGYLGILHNAQGIISVPLQSISHSFTEGFRAAWESVTNVGKLKEENRELRAKLIESEQLLRLNEIKSANTDDQSLEKAAASQLGFEEGDISVATVFDRNVANKPGFLLINKGSLNKIKENQPVIAHGIFIGTIAEVYDSYAIVKTIFVNGYSFSATVENRQVTGLASTVQSQISLQEILINETIEQNDIVSALLFNNSIRVPFGKISSILDSSDKVTKSAILETFVQLENIDNVIVLIK